MTWLGSVDMLVHRRNLLFLALYNFLHQNTCPSAEDGLDVLIHLKFHLQSLLKSGFAFAADATSKGYAILVSLVVSFCDRTGANFR
jgi:hypothetical protein